MTTPTKIAVVIATCNRTHLMKTRTLPSIAAQARSPDFLIVVDDSIPSTRQANAELLSSLTLRNCTVVYRENARTAGASGAWNTALEFLLEEVSDVHNLFVAILDDDDSWSAEYLDRCEAVAIAYELDAVATGLRRIESGSPTPLLSQAPKQLRAEDFLTGNPGIQCSNFFLRFSVLLAVGGFDEALCCTTDRDLCIQISDLGTVRYGTVSATLLNHYADSDRPRLSTPGSEHKLKCLTSFWRKYAGRMTADQRQAFIVRADKLFHWLPPSDVAGLPGFIAVDDASALNLFGNNSNANDAFGIAPPHNPLKLYVGVITSDPKTLAVLLGTLVSLASSSKIDSLSVLILDNSSPQGKLEDVTEQARLAGLNVVVIGEKKQNFDAAAGRFGKAFRHRPKGRVGIAMARTMLQKYLGALLATDTNAFGWILDDDMQVDERASVYLSWLPAFREQGTDVLIGATEGLPPNPPLNGLRVNLVDLLHNLRWLRNLPEDAVLPDRTAENENLRLRFPDYYYDLSRKHTDHLEMPCWLEPAAPGETVREALYRLIGSAVDLLNGYSTTRPLIITPTPDPLVSAKKSVNRDGNTFILNHRALSETPNTIINLHEQEARRSDMVWAIVNQQYRRMNIKAVAFPVHHASRVNSTPNLDIDKVQAEIIGSTLYSGLTEFLQTRPHHQLEFSCEDIIEICLLADVHLARRWRMLEQNIYRIAGLREAIRRISHARELQELIGYLDEWFTPDLYSRIRSGVTTHDRDNVQVFLNSLRCVADDYALANIDITCIQKEFSVNTIGNRGAVQ